MHRTPILDRGLPRRMWLGDACREFGWFAVGTSIVMSMVCGSAALVSNSSLFLATAIAACGVLLVAPLGMCGVTLAWRMTLGMKYSARLRPGDFRFAGILCVVVVWASAAAGEYVMHLADGHALVSATVWPVVIGALTCGSAVQVRRRTAT